MDRQYMLFGGMPLVLSKEGPEEKFAYLDGLFEEVYFRDILERYEIGLPSVLSEFVDDLCSSVGSLKEEAELRPLLAVRDFHKKVVVSQSVMPPWVDEAGVLRLGIYDFLLDEGLIE